MSASNAVDKSMAGFDKAVGACCKILRDLAADQKWMENLPMKEMQKQATQQVMWLRSKVGDEAASPYNILTKSLAAFKKSVTTRPEDKKEKKDKDKNEAETLDKVYAKMPFLQSLVTWAMEHRTTSPPSKSYSETRDGQG